MKKSRDEMLDMADKLADALKDRPLPKAWCSVCGEVREHDLSYHGAGKAGFTYFPCHHSSHSSQGEPTIWKDEKYRVVPEDKLIQKGA